MTTSDPREPSPETLAASEAETVHGAEPSPGESPGPARESGEGAPERVAGYRILRAIASGGMGVVYEAEQENPRRRVALKVVRPGMGSEEFLRRFRFEAETLARFEHPFIARIHEAGTFDTGAGPQPFFAMEYVDGIPLTLHAKRGGLSLSRRVALLADVCDAVEYAHRKGIVHRDLKPGNILADGDGKPRILDFGLARTLDSRDSEAEARTETGRILGTLHYLSPEQARGSADVDTRSDVYALGVVGYELLSGRLPGDLRGRPVHEILASILTEEAEPLSASDPALRGDLDTIFAKALEKDRERRYSSAAEFAADLRRFLRDEPVSARPPSLVYTARKFARRNKATVAGGIAVLLALVAGVVATARQARIAARNAKEATHQRDLAVAAREEAESLARVAQRERYVATLRYANQSLAGGRPEQARDALLEIDESLRDAEWGFLLHSTFRRPPAIARASEFGSVEIRHAPDGSFAVAAMLDARLRIWRNFEDGGVPTDLVVEGHNWWVGDCDASPDSRFVASAGSDGYASVWDAASGERVWSRRIETKLPLCARFADGGRGLFVATIEGDARVYNLGSPDGEPSRAIDFDRPVSTAAISAADGRVALACETGDIVVLDRAGRVEKETGDGPKIGATSLEFSADGRNLAGAAPDGAFVWRLDRDGPPIRLSGHTGGVMDAEWNAAGTRVFTAAMDRTVRVWDPESGRELLAFDGLPDWARCVSISRDGLSLAVGCEDGSFVFRTAAPWRADMLPAADGETWEERFEKRRERLGLHWAPLPAPRREPALAFEDFSTTATFDGSNPPPGWSASGAWIVEGGRLKSAGAEGMPHRVACLVRDLPMPERYAFECDVFLPPGGRFGVVADVATTSAAVRGIRSFRGVVLGLDRFDVDRPGLAIPYRRAGGSVGWGELPRALLQMPVLAESAEWSEKPRFRLRVERIPGEMRAFADGEFVGKYAPSGGEAGAAGLAAYLGDAVPSAEYDNLAIYALE